MEHEPDLNTCIQRALFSIENLTKLLRIALEKNELEIREKDCKRPRRIISEMVDFLYVYKNSIHEKASDVQSHLFRLNGKNSEMSQDPTEDNEWV